MNGNQAINLRGVSLNSNLASKILGENNKAASEAAGKFPSIIDAIEQGNYNIAAELIGEAMEAKPETCKVFLAETLKALADCN